MKIQQLTIIHVLLLMPCISNAQVVTPSKQHTCFTENKITTGVQYLSLLGPWPSTALSDQGSAAKMKTNGNTVKTFGMGLLIKYKVSERFHLVLDGTLYNYAIKIATKGESIESEWTKSQEIKHWDEPNARHTSQLDQLKGDVYFDMLSAGVRLSGRYYLRTNKLRPWLGAGLGYYGWQVNYCDETKLNSYGADHGTITGLTYSAGVDLLYIKGLTISFFVDHSSPVAHYTINDLFYKSWNISSEAPIIGANRLGMAVLF